MDTQEAIKKYWPWAVGGIVGLWLISRAGGSSSGGSDLAAFYAAQTQAGAQAQQASLQNAALQAQIDNAAAERQLQRDALTIEGNIGYIQAQAAMANAVGQSAAGVVGALYQPINTAMAAAATENAAAFGGAAQVAAAGFLAQTGMVQAVAETTQAASDSLQIWGPLSQGIAQITAAQKLPALAMSGAATQLGTAAINKYGTGNYLSSIGGR